jgi:hypothetical protein
MHPINARCMRDVFARRYSMDAAVLFARPTRVEPPVHVLTNRCAHADGWIHVKCQGE